MKPGRSFTERFSNREVAFFSAVVIPGVFLIVAAVITILIVGCSSVMRIGVIR